MDRLLLALSVALSLACPGDRAPRDEPALEDQAALADEPADTVSVAQELAAAGVDSLAASACDLAAEILAATPGRTQAGSTPVADPDTGLDLPGCRVSLSGSVADLGAAQRPDVVLGARFTAASWQYDDRWTADGPDGTSFVLRKDDVFCIVEGRWDGGVDDDPTYQPPPDFTFDVRCANRAQTIEER